MALKIEFGWREIFTLKWKKSRFWLMIGVGLSYTHDHKFNILLDKNRTHTTVCIKFKDLVMYLVSVLGSWQ